jgi:hypothetical protein
MNDVNKELSQFDADEAAQVAFATENGFTAEELKVAKADIAEERLFVEVGAETAEEAEAAVDDNIRKDLGLDDPSDDNCSFGDDSCE